MKIRRMLLIAPFALLGFAALLPAQNTKEQKQQAKLLSEKAKSESDDRVRQVQDACAAVELDVKNKKYAETCNGYRSKLAEDDAAKYKAAQDAYLAHDADKAETLAKQVSTFDDRLSSQAHAILDHVRADRVFADLKAAWAKGDFLAVSSAAQALSSSDYKIQAKGYTDEISRYYDHIAQGQKLEKENKPQEAVNEFVAAKELNPNGPDDPAGKIAEVTSKFQALYSPTPTKVVPTKAQPGAGLSPADLAAKVGKLMADAHTAETGGKTQDALNAYASVLKLQPANKDARAANDRLEAAVKSNPAEAKNELVAAIRSFYHGQLDDAERALRDYLKSGPTPPNAGAANFYLGMALVEDSMLANAGSSWAGPSDDAKAAFAEARKASYVPVRDYVSPKLMKVWDANGQ